jgi:serine/threonine-protein kinase HipA
VPGLLADALPDKFGNAIIQDWLARNGRSPNDLNPVEKLCFIGKRGMGALEFEPAQSVGLGTVDALEVADLLTTAQAILNN